MVLRDMGKAGLAVLVLGSVACSEEGAGEESGTSTTAGGEGTTSPRETTATTEAAATSTTDTTAAPGASTSFDWQRVNLGFVSAYLLYRAGEAVLVDTGVANSEDAIEAALAEIGLGWDAVGHVVVTHRHPDHQGSLDGVLTRSADSPWYAGEGDLQAINASSEGVVVADGDNVFGLGIIETPGHTPGHISVLDPTAGILVAGDALNGANGGLVGANPDFSDDMTLANASVQKLAGFDYEVVLFGHGEPVLQGGSAAVAELAAGLG